MKKLTFDASARALERKILHAHTYFDITPKNNIYENEYDVCGPKAHIEFFENGKTMGNYSMLLLKYFPLILKTLKNEYSGHCACSSNFIANINTKITKEEDFFQFFLEEYKNNNDNTGYIGCDPRNIELCGEENKYLIEALKNNPEARHELDLLRREF